jgi:hypothetical protein
MDMSRLDAHYEAVRERYDYEELTLPLGDRSPSTLQRRFVAVDGTGVLAAAFDRPTIAITGVGMTGPPHLGTVGQILTAISLQEAGLDVQFVIADLEPYHSGADLESVRRLAERYRQFVRSLGFDPEQGVLRTQEDAPEVMRTAEVLAPYYTPTGGMNDPTSGPLSGNRRLRTHTRTARTAATPARIAEEPATPTVTSLARPRRRPTPTAPSSTASTSSTLCTSGSTSRRS